MNNSNKHKSQFLGVPFGTACNKLRKNILFKLLQKLKENICFRCHLEIVTVGDLSIEHKEPWEGRSIALFWDLDNIAFSHLHCNRPHKHGMQKYTPEEALRIKRERTAQYMRDVYTTEKRQEKYQRSGY